MHDGMPYGRNQGQGHSWEVDRQSPTGLIFVITLHVCLAAAQCTVISPVCGFLFVCGCVCGSVTTITRNWCIDLHQTGSGGEGSDHLQLTKFWLSCAPGKGSPEGRNFFSSALLQPARSVCISPSAFSSLLFCC